MKKCELCNKVARMYCESDEARLCWDCDLRVHTANFLVAKHTRTLLCHACQSPTPWTASGPKLAPTVSVCEACANAGKDGVEDDAENQVVPLSLASTSSSSTTTKAALELSTPATSYHVAERAEEKSGAKKMRSWMWR